MAIPAKYLQPVQTVGIVYWGRSGSILLHSLLDSHPDVLSCNAYFWMYSSQMDEFLASNHGSCLERLLTFICESFPYLFEHWPTFFPEMFRGPNRDLRFGTDRDRFIVFFREYLSHFPKGTPFCELPAGQTIHSFVLQAIHVAYAMAQGQALDSQNPTIVWQTHFWQADYFRERFPNIRMLSAVRHPLRGYDSWQLRGYVDEKVPPFWFYHTVRFRQMMEFMKVPADLADRCRAIRFEDIHNRTEEVMRSLASWLNIRWNECLLKSTFDGEPYWGVKGGCTHRIKAGEIAPIDVLVTGTRQFDESKMELKYLGIIDSLRMKTFCEEAFENWGYESSNRDHRIRRFLKRFRSLLMLLPSKLDRRSHWEDLRLELNQIPRFSLVRKYKCIAKSLAKFATNKWQFRKEMLEIKQVQADWIAIPAVYIPGEYVMSEDQTRTESSICKAA